VGFHAWAGVTRVCNVLTPLPMGNVSSGWAAAGSLGVFFVVLLGACAFDDSPDPKSSTPSCKLIAMPCSALDDNPLCSDLPGCRQKFACQGTPSCAAALTSPNSQFPEQNCDDPATGCSWNGSACVGTPLPCSAAIYQQDTIDCEDVGCTLTQSCVGGNVAYDCSLQPTESRCSEYPFCAWK
jgi:hypothetical protein